MDMDLLQGFKERMDNMDAEEIEKVSGKMPDFGEFQMPSLDKILEALEHMDLPEEDKQEMRNTLMREGQLLETLGAAADPEDPSNMQLMIFIIAVSLIATLFVFFGYKLYKSLTEKERKREEKKKQKQQKKKK